MNCFCPKCGRKIEISADELHAQKGMVVCPKCLTTFRAPRITDDDDDETPPPIPVRKRKSEPAPRKSTATVRYCNKCGKPLPPGKTTCPSCTTPAPKRPTPAPVKKAPQRRVAPKRESRKSVSKWGCLLYSVAITMAFFLLYALIGLLFN
ncbi:MAG: MJ0042-type zinc finger domain-containing protein [Sodaliphilus sp.]